MLTDSQRLVIKHLHTGSRLMWIPDLRIARYIGEYGHIYAKTFEGLRRKGAIVRAEVLSKRGGLPLREVWRAA